MVLSLGLVWSFFLLIAIPLLGLDFQFSLGLSTLLCWAYLDGWAWIFCRFAGDHLGFCLLGLFMFVDVNSSFVGGLYSVFAGNHIFSLDFGGLLVHLVNLFDVNFILAGNTFWWIIF